MQVVTANFARKLERERDGARAGLVDLDNMQDQRDLAMKVISRLEHERDEARAVAGELADVASKYLSFLLAVTPAKTNETHEKETMIVIDAIKRWKKL